MISQQLIDYIKQQLALGKTQTEITPVLLSAGWNADDVTQAFQNLNGTGTSAMVESSARTNLPPIGDLFKESWELMKKRVGIAFASGIILFLIFLGALIAGGIIEFVVYKYSSYIPAVILGVILIILAVVSYFYFIFWGYASSITAFSATDENLSIKENLRRAKPFIPSMILTSIILVMAIIGGYVLLIIPGIILALRYGFAPYIVVVEGKTGREAIAQSKAYVMGRTGEMFLRLFAVYAIYFVPALIIQLLKFSNNSGVNILGGIVTTVIQIFYYLFFGPYMYTMYNHFKATSGPTEPKKYIGGITGWAIWGAVGWVIIVLLIIFGITALTGLNKAKSQIRDAKRVSDIRQLTVGLELYHNDHNKYPQSLDELVPGYTPTKITAPTPADGSCPPGINDYIYSTKDNFQNYSLSYCLGQATGGNDSGINIISSKNSIPNTDQPTTTPAQAN